MSLQPVVDHLLRTSFDLAAAEQCPETVQAQMPNPYGAPISVETAKKIAEAALMEARRNKWTMAVAVVDTGAHLVYYEKMDHTQVASAKVAIDKARSAVLYKRPTKALQDALAAGGAGMRVLKLNEAIPIEGGLPIIANGAIIGGIGLSGDTSEHDGQCAKAGLEILR
jgi:uncharacterized protein GlcG (DUF336 family)